MKINKDFYHPMPDHFRQQIISSISKAKGKETKSHSFSFKRIAIALAALIVLIPLSIFGVCKTVEYFSSMEQTNQFAFQPNFKTTDENGKALSSPEYVKFHFTPDEKYVPADDFDKIRYLFADESDDGYAFQFSLARPTDGKLQSIQSINTYHSIYVKGNEGFFIDAAGKITHNRVILFFEKVNMAVEAFFNPILTEAEVISILERVDVTEGTKEDNTPYGLPSPSAPTYFQAENTTADFSRFCDSKLTLEGEKMDIATGKVFATVNKIYVEKNIGQRDENDFLISELPRKLQIDENGNVLPRTDEKWTYEKGAVAGYDYIPTFISKVEHERVLVFAEITYTNVTSEAQKFPLNHDLRLFSHGEEDIMYYSQERLGEKWFSAELNPPVYIENAEEWDIENGAEQPPQCFNIGLLQPGESRTLTIGWTCDADLIDQAYLSFSQHNTGGHLPYYNIKVAK